MHLLHNPIPVFPGIKSLGPSLRVGRALDWSCQLTVACYLVCMQVSAAAVALASVTGERTKSYPYSISIVLCRAGCRVPSPTHWRERRPRNMACQEEIDLGAYSATLFTGREMVIASVHVGFVGEETY